MTMHVDVMDLMAKLKSSEEAFVLATVVRTVSVTAAKAGAKAIIRPDGMIAGAIAEHQGVPPSTMSHHLATLERAGLVQSERESRLIHYRADYPGMRRLLMFLLQDCCQGAPEMCGDLFAQLNCNAPQSLNA